MHSVHSMNILTRFHWPSMASGMQSTSSGSLNFAQMESDQMKGRPSIYALPNFIQNEVLLPLTDGFIDRFDSTCLISSDPKAFASIEP